MRLIFLGPPGAGKGTQAKAISKKFKVVHISTGDILREAVKNKSEIGKQAKAFMDKGDLVPDELVIKVVVERLARPDTAEGFILDGFPRTEKQATSLDSELEKAGLTVDSVIYFDTSEETSVKRLSGRRVCKNCGANYHTITMRPKKDRVCDICAGELYQREDDKEVTVKNRLKVYQQQTAGLIDYYKSRGSLKTVCGDLNVDGLLNKMVEFFKEQSFIR
ncbi:MAG: adenylate kinase [Candidatus Omnitrophica bacterium]|nr:adenylate kinase [Candidatus Omnitrophota bacterium]